MTPCVLDTDVVIAALDDGDAHHRDAARAIKKMLEAATPLLLSPVNYAEALVKPAEDEQTLRVAVDAIAALGIGLVAPTPAIARDAARHRGLSINLADGFALATAQARSATVASFDQRVRRAASSLGLELSPALA